MMLPRVKDVKPGDDYTLQLTFANGEIRIFDVKPYLDRGFFRSLRDKREFNTVRPYLGSIRWRQGQDFCPDTLYLNSVAVLDFGQVGEYRLRKSPAGHFRR